MASRRPSPPLTLLLATDFTLHRAGLRALLEKRPRVARVTEADDGREAVKLAAALKPSVAVLDASMGGLNGFEAAPMVRAASPSTRVILLLDAADSQTLLRALQSDAAGLVLHTTRPADLFRIVETGSRPWPAVCRTMPREALRRALELHRAGCAPLDPLTARQREVLQLLAEGASTKRIALTLGISVKTVEAHRCQVMDRLQIRDAVGLVRYALRRGLTRL